MGISRTVGEVISFLITAISLGLDVSQVDNSPRWQVIALFAFLVFAGLMAWHLWSLRQELTADREALALGFEPDSPQADHPPFLVKADGDGKRVLITVWAYIKVRNTSQRPIRISSLWFEVVQYHHLFFRRVIARAAPHNWGHDADWYKRSHPEQVEWRLDPVSQEESIRAFCSELVPAQLRPGKASLEVTAILGKPNMKRSLRLWEGSPTP